MKLDNATQPCHSALDTAGDPPATDRAPCGRYPAWYVVRTAHHAERLATIEIGVNGFDVFCPMLRLPESPARRYTNGAVRPARPARVVPLFRRYLFARFDRQREPWRTILRMPGVETIISNAPEKPVPVPQEAIEGLMDLCDEVGVYKPPSPPPRPLMRGSRLKVLSGPFADHVGFCQMSSGKRVQMLMEIMGQSVTVSMSQTDVSSL